MIVSPWLVGGGNHRDSAFFKVYVEISAILGLPQNDAFESHFWASVGVECGRNMRAFFDQPGWRNAVENEIATH
jgi:hypothetical protein